MKTEFCFLIAIATALSGAIANSQTVSYTLGTPTELLDAAFYAGEAADGSNVSGRGLFNVGINNAGTEALVWGINLSTLQMGLFAVTVGQPSSWSRVSTDEPFNYNAITWCPDDRHAYVGPNRKFDTVTQTMTIPTMNGWTFSAWWVSSKPTDNWMASSRNVGFGTLPVMPILPNGEHDPGRQNTYVTNFTVLPTEGVGFPSVSSDGNSIVFAIANGSTNPDTGNVYRLTGLNAILVAPKIPATDISSTAPTSLADPRIVEIRASATPNPVVLPRFSPDGSLVFTTEDYNNVFDSQNFFGTVFTDWDININNWDGTGYTRLAQPGGQGAVYPFNSGVRVHFVSEVSPSRYHAFAATLTSESDVDSETDPIPGAGTNMTTVNGNPVTVPFTLTNSAVATTAPVTVADASGTTIALPADQVINYPTGTANATISVFTPISPVQSVQLPDPQTSIPVLRDFGPEGTQFFPPITVTITYTDAEVANIEDESAMIPYLYNVGLGMFEPLDSAFLPSVVVDTVNNTLSFQTDHFSTYGIGGKGVPATSQRPWAVVILSVLLGVASFIVVGNRIRRKA